MREAPGYAPGYYTGNDGSSASMATVGTPLSLTQRLQTAEADIKELHVVFEQAMKELESQRQAFRDLRVAVFGN